MSEEGSLKVDWILQETPMSLHALSLRFTTIKGVGVMLAPAGMSDPFQVLDLQTNGGDDCQVMESVFLYTDWFPYRQGISVSDAMRELNVMLAKIPRTRKHDWELYVQDLVNHFVATKPHERRNIQVVSKWADFPNNDSGQPWK